MGRYRVLIILGLLFLAAFISVRQVRFSADILTMLPADLPEVQGMDWLNQHFARDGEMILTLSAPDALAAEESARDLTDTLLSHPELVSDVFWELPLDRLAQEASGMLAWFWLNGDPSQLDVLEQRLAKGQSEQQIEETLEILQDAFLDGGTIMRAYDPLGLSAIPDGLDSLGESEVNPLVSKDGSFRALYVEGSERKFADYREAAAWTEELRHIVAEWQKARLEQDPQAPKVEVGFTGTPAFMGEIGTGMEKDMRGSMTLTTLLISVLFWLMHRRHLPLMWLVVMMLIIFCVTINLASLFFGHLSVMSAGFAAILMGLAVDYGVVLYREGRHAEGSAEVLRRKIGPSVIWAAATTAAVFLSLNLSSLPGISQLGTLVSIGIAVGALVMLYLFSPLAVKFPVKGTLRDIPSAEVDAKIGKYAPWAALAVLALVLLSSLIKGAPHMDREFRPFNMRSGKANAAWQDMETHLRADRDAAPLIVVGTDPMDLSRNLKAAAERMAEAENAGLLHAYQAPVALVPNPENQRANAARIAQLFPEEPRLLQEIEAAGFSEDGLTLTQEMFQHWRDYRAQLEADPEAIVFAAGDFANWSVRRMVTHDDSQWAVLGTVTPNKDEGRAWIEAVCSENAAVASMRSLGTALNERIGRDLVRVFLPMIIILSLMLSLVFRNWRDVLLTIFTMGFGAAVIIVVTQWTSLGWNSFNVCGVPLLFGTGLDYAIHMIFALRRADGSLQQVRHGISRALIFCGLSTTIGFGSLAMSSAEGLASLGQVCALGVLVNMLAAVFLLPHWWSWVHRKEFQTSTAAASKAE